MNKKTTEQTANAMATAIENALAPEQMGMDVAIKASAQALVSLSDALDCRRIVDGESAIAIFNTADAFAEIGTLAKAKALARAKLVRVGHTSDNPNGVTVWAHEGLKTFEEWANKHFGLSASQAQNYVKAAPYIEECGTRTQYAKDGRDYTVAGIIAVIEAKGAKNADAIRKALADEVSPSMTVAEIKRKFMHELTDAKVTETPAKPENKPTEGENKPTDNITAKPTEGAQTAKKAEKQPEKVAKVTNKDDHAVIGIDIPVPAGAVITVSYGDKTYTYVAKLID